MAIRVRCECGKTLLAADAAVGKKGRCPACGRLIVITPEDSSPLPPAALGTTAAYVPPDPFLDSSDTTITGHPRPRVLIADAIPGDVDMLTRGFLEHGYKVIYTTSNGNDAVDKVRELKPEVAVVDVRLEGSSGFRVVRTLTDPLNPRNKDLGTTLFVMTTDTLHGRDKQYALSLGVEIFVEKPYIPTRIFPRINKRLKR